MADVGHHPLPALPPQGQQQQLQHSRSHSQSLGPTPPTHQSFQQPTYQPQQNQQQQQQQQQQHYHQQSYHNQQAQHVQYQQPSHQPQSQQNTRFSKQPQPPSLQKQQPPQLERNQTKPRSFSFRSDRSHGSNSKNDLHETSAEKEAKRLHSKADPTLAMNEAEPAVVQATAKSSLAPLRSIQHKDAFGNAIADPDRSNPTRSRWERPLDTIRSFEAAIDGGYSRKSFIRTDTDSQVNFNRRSSYYGAQGPRFPRDSYYGGQQGGPRGDYNGFEQRAPTRESYFGPDGYNGNGNAASYGMSGANGRQRASRMQSQPEFSTYGRNGEGTGGSVYPLPHKDRSYETVTSATGSGSSADHAGYQTDPTSSENSSIDRTSPAKPPQPNNDYGIGFSQPSAFQPQAFSVGTNGGSYPQGGPVGGYGGPPKGFPGKKPVSAPNFAAAPPPPVPQKDVGGNAGVLRRPVPQQTRPEMPEKRKSWFSRRFSRAS